MNVRGNVIAVIDYGVGNVPSVLNMLQRIGVKGFATNDRSEIMAASKIILPGVGAFDVAMSKLHSMGLRNLLTEIGLQERIPMLGICLGMQLLGEGSEEGLLPGLGLIPGIVRKLPSSNEIKVPHMGWNNVKVEITSGLLAKEDSSTRFYFAHSYYFDVLNQENVIGITSHGIDFCSVVAKKNIFGVQFHPEKSHQNGLRLLSNFVRQSD